MNIQFALSNRPVEESVADHCEESDTEQEKNKGETSNDGNFTVIANGVRIGTI